MVWGVEERFGLLPKGRFWPALAYQSGRHNTHQLLLDASCQIPSAIGAVLCSCSIIKNDSYSGAIAGRQWPKRLELPQQTRQGEQRQQQQPHDDGAPHQADYAAQVRHLGVSAWGAGAVAV